MRGAFKNNNSNVYSLFLQIIYNDCVNGRGFLFYIFQVFEVSFYLKSFLKYNFLQQIFFPKILGLPFYLKLRVTR